MRTAKRFALFCIMCLLCQPILAQRRVRLADLPPFERAVVVVKYFEGLHNKPKDFPYVGYGHQLQPGEHFKDYGKDALLLSLLAYKWVWGDCLVMESIPRADCYEK